eukprot:TRINITY_DN1753_c0_g1_i1.p1 TRINITY_DN1753_c0_g1~~TRINITY_DN1753_c0_g1_i1.p1  ORF type:complete len:270 (-),score=44.68 TRINITY_DN1753_c0_g1_i1:46-855(-)
MDSVSGGSAEPVKSSLEIASDVVGWGYFVCWSLSFYPQVWLNYRRKSVLGLSMDFMLYNVVGYILYGVSNTARYWFFDDPSVAFNDVAFPVHALILTTITIGQIFYYDRDGLASSISSLGMVSAIWLSIIINAFIAIGKGETWPFLIGTWLAWMKILITLVKYIPQAWMNYKRKSTVGWSIGNVLLDISGGTLSILQMFLMAIIDPQNNPFTENPQKVGLAIISIAFDVLFIVQHYVIYPHRPRPSAQLSTNNSSPTNTYTPLREKSVM